MMTMATLTVDPSAHPFNWWFPIIPPLCRCQMYQNLAFAAGTTQVLTTWWFYEKFLPGFLKKPSPAMSLMPSSMMMVMAIETPPWQWCCPQPLWKLQPSTLSVGDHCNFAAISRIKQCNAAIPIHQNCLMYPISDTQHAALSAALAKLEKHQPTFPPLLAELCHPKTNPTPASALGWYVAWWQQLAGKAMANSRPAPSCGTTKWQRLIWPYNHCNPSTSWLSLPISQTSWSHWWQWWQPTSQWVLIIIDAHGNVQVANEGSAHNQCAACWVIQKMTWFLPWSNATIKTWVWIANHTQSCSLQQPSLQTTTLTCWCLLPIPPKPQSPMASRLYWPLQQTSPHFKI